MATIPTTNTTAADPESDNFTSNVNPLRNFRSYSYHFFMVACESTDVLNYLLTDSSDAFERKNFDLTNPRDAITIDGVGDYVIVIDSRSDTDFILDNVEWGTTFVGETNSSKSTVGLNTVMTDGMLNILEPRGVNFLNVLADLGDQLDVDMICMPFMLKTVFYGHNEDGTVTSFTNVQPLGFVPVDITGSVDERGTMYKMSICGVVNGIVFNPSYNAIVDNVGFEVTLGQNLDYQLQKFTQQLNDTYRKQRDQVLLDFGTRLNIDGAADVVYNIALEPGSQKLHSIKDFGANQPDHFKPTNSKFIITGTKEGGIAEVIKKLMDSSSEWMSIAAQGDPPDAASVHNTNKRYTFKVTSEFNKTSASLGKNVVTINIFVSEYIYETVDVVTTIGGTKTVQPQPNIDPSQVVQFDYIYTGKNLDILHMDLNLSMGLALLQTLSTSKSLSSQKQDVTGGQPPLTTPVLANTPSGGGFNRRGQIRKGTPIFVPLQWANDYMKELNTIQNSATADAIWRNFAGYQSVNTNITIHGNPLLLAKLVNPDRGTPNYVRINIKMPSTSQDIWEYNTPNNQSPGGYYKDFWFNGYYLIFSAVNKFHNGLFTQELELVSLPQVSNIQGESAAATNTQQQNLTARQWFQPVQTHILPNTTITPDNDVTAIGTGLGSIAVPSGISLSGNQQAFVKTFWNDALTASQASGIDPDFLLAQAALETGYGHNTLTQYANLFSIKSFGKPNSYWDGSVTIRPQTTDRPYRAYINPSQGFLDQTLLLKRLYPQSASAPPGPGGINQYANGLQNGTGGRRFAEDPTYPTKIVSAYNNIQGIKNALGIVNNTYIGTPPSPTTPTQGPYLAQNVTAPTSGTTTNASIQVYSTERTVAQASVDQKRAQTTSGT